MDEDVNKTEWLKKRVQTRRAFILHSFFIGVEYSIFIVNIWIYITDLVKTDQPKFFYSLISFAYLLVASLSSLVLCKIADKSRCIRKLFLVTNIAYVIGNALYLFNHSPWLLVVARGIAGIGQTQRSIIAGEVARVYCREEISSMFSVMGFSHGIGFTIAPLLNIASKHVSQNYKFFNISSANMSGIYMAIIFTCLQFIDFFLIHNLSKEYDLKSESAEYTVSSEDENNEQECLMKSYLSEEDKKYELDKEIKSNNTCIKSDTMELIIKLFTKPDPLLLLTIQFTETFLIFSFDMCMPILIINRLKWSTTIYYILMSAGGLASIIPACILVFKRLTDRCVFLISTAGVISYAYIQGIEMIWAYKLGSHTTNIVLSVIHSLLFSTVVVIRDVFISGFLAKMVASRWQASVDAVRLFVSRGAAGLAMTTAVFLLDYIDIVGSVYILIVLLLFFALFLRRKTLQNPNIKVT